MAHTAQLQHTSTEHRYDSIILDSTLDLERTIPHTLNCLALKLPNPPSRNRCLISLIFQSPCQLRIYLFCPQVLQIDPLSCRKPYHEFPRALCELALKPPTRITQVILRWWWRWNITSCRDGDRRRLDISWTKNGWNRVERRWRCWRKICCRWSYIKERYILQCGVHIRLSGRRRGCRQRGWQAGLFLAGG